MISSKMSFKDALLSIKKQTTTENDFTSHKQLIPSFINDPYTQGSQLSNSNGIHLLNSRKQTTVENVTRSTEKTAYFNRSSEVE